MIRVADYIMNRIQQEQVKHVFTITGRGILYLTDALARCEGLESISVHHEQAASYAAYGYAQTVNDLGVCMVSTGCAGTNTVTGLLCAWQDGVPCLFISGQNMLEETSYYTGIPIRTYGSQEADIVNVVKPLTKYAVMITKPEDIVYELDKAIYMAREGRKGPVWIDIPLDIQNMRIDPDNLEHFYPENIIEFKPRQEAIQYVIESLEVAKRPIILIGSGVKQSGAQAKLKKYIETIKVPIVFAPSAVDTYGAGEQYSIGAVGSLGGSRCGNFAIQNADLIIVLGHRLSSMTTGGQFEKFGRDAKIVAVDIDKIEYTKKMVSIDRFIHADVNLFLDKMMDETINSCWDDWCNTCLHWKQVFPKCEDKYKESEKVDLYNLASELSRQLPKDGIVVTDAGFEELLIPSTLELSGEQKCIHPVSQGAMGFSLPAAEGVYFASKGTVISVNGDGSIMMNLQELQTISYYQIPVKVIIANNNCYAVIRKRQQDLFRTRTIGTDESNGVSCPSFKKVAAAFDIPYMCIEATSELSQGISKLMQTDGPVICEVMCVEQQEYLHSSIAKGQDKRMVRRPIEDQSPFMDRELFLSEMIIEPIDQ